MKWFGGNVSTAIQISRKNNALLIVFIYTDDDKGKLLSSLFDQIDASILSCPVVGIRLKDGEQATRQFSEIYPTPILPAAYLIDQSGKPVDIITTLLELNYDTFRARLNKAVEKFVKNNPAAQVSVSNVRDPIDDVLESVTAVDPADILRAMQEQVASRNALAAYSASSQVSPSPVSSAAPPASAPVSPPVPAPAPVSSAPSPVPVSSSASSSGSSGAVHSSSEMTLEEKVKKAKELLEQKRKIESERKANDEKEKELQRIKDMKAAQEAKKTRQDQELREAAAQRARDKLEAEKEKERVKAQIRADREDAEYRRLRAQGKELPKTEEVKETVPPKRIASDKCRVQVRLPGGSSVIEELPSGDNLLSIIEILKQKNHVSGKFQLALFYPRHLFTEEELAKSFLDLSLTPNCTLVVIQSGTNSSVTKANGGLFAFISLLFLTPFQYIWGFLKSFLGPPSQPSSRSDAPSTSRTPDSRPPGIPRSAEIRRRGNVSALHNSNGDESDDETKKNWNGNSTQYM